MMNRLKLSILSFLGAATIRLLGKSMSLKSHGFEPVDRIYREGCNIILAFWHGQQLMIPLGYRGPHPEILISQHRDGELIYRIVKRFGYGAVRGSATRGGHKALRQLIRLGQAGVDLVITPDGPKGPRHRIQPGIVALAKFTGLPIVPLAFACSKKKSFPVGTGL
ncbi:MAG: lysophospholipid acyltransferase family protein [Nitrospira sp.]|nr:lysophospholipid acyltransferase family protein [Nitrospira sp.]